MRCRVPSLSATTIKRREDMKAQVLPNKGRSKASSVHDSMKTPFSTATFFETDNTVLVNREIKARRKKPN